MNLDPYVSFGEIRFGDNTNKIEERYGKPISQRENARGECEYDYDNIVVRFAAERGVVECSAQLESIDIHGNTVNISELAEYLAAHDLDTKESLGFVISPSFGIAIDVTPNQSQWISVFERGRWDKIF